MLVLFDLIQSVRLIEVTWSVDVGTDGPTETTPFIDVVVTLHDNQHRIFVRQGVNLFQQSTMRKIPIVCGFHFQTQNMLH